MVVYILLGLTGLPVFSGGMGGPGKLFGPTGGYIWAYVAAVFLMSWFKGKEYNFRRYSLAAVAIGIPVIYIGGVLQLKGITGMPWEAAIMSGVVPFIPLDIVKSLCAAALARPLLAINKTVSHE